MITTEHLTADQLAQLDALLADTTLGGGVYRPPVAQDTAILNELVKAKLAYPLQDVLFDHFEVTDAGRAIVVGRARDAADTEAFLREADAEQLRDAIRKLKAVFNDLTDVEERERTLADIEACQDALDELADGQSESTGRHRVVPADDRPTEHLPRVQEQTAPMPSTGTLPGLPVVESAPSWDLRLTTGQIVKVPGEPPAFLGPDPDEQATVRMIAAIRATPTPDEMAQLAADHTAGWAALEADLGDERPWWRRKLTPARVLVLSIVTTVVVTWGIAWLVMA